MNDGVINSDLELARQVAAGSETAFRQLFETYRKRMFGYIYKLVDNPELAEDMVQEIFMRLWRSRASLLTVENLNAYLHRVARNVAYNGFELHAKEQLLISELQRQEGSATEFHHGDELIAKEVKEQIYRIIETLTPHQRKIFQLSREGGLKHEEIATLLGISVFTVRKQIARSLKVLRTELGRDYGSEATILFVIFQLVDFFPPLD